MKGGIYGIELYLNKGVIKINFNLLGIIVLFTICKCVWVLLLRLSYKH